MRSNSMGVAPSGAGERKMAAVRKMVSPCTVAAQHSIPTSTPVHGRRRNQNIRIAIGRRKTENGPVAPLKHTTSISKVHHAFVCGGSATRTRNANKARNVIELLTLAWTSYDVGTASNRKDMSRRMR